MTKFATGRNAWFTCQRCGLRGRYVDSVSDGEYPGLRVHSACRDIKHPAEKPFLKEDGIALAHPVPDLDASSDPPNEDGPTLVDNLMPLNGGTFGGGT